MEYVVASGAAEITDPIRAIVFKAWSPVARYTPTTDVFWAIVPSVRAVASKNDCSNIMGTDFLVFCQIRS